jgi:integrase
MHRCARNPAREIDKGLLFPKPQVQHFAALALDQVGPWLRGLNAVNFAPTIRTALYLMFVTGLRDAALRAAKWSEFDLDAGLWLVPEARRKTRITHPGDQRLPLPRQAVTLLRELAELTDTGPESFVFESYGKHGYLAENTLAKAMRDLGFAVTVHGFRSLLTDLLTPLGFIPFAIDRQLDHAIGHTGERTGAGSADPKVLAAYLRADFLDYRRDMMQWVADWADAMAAGKKAPALPMGMVQPAAVIELRPAA